MRWVALASEVLEMVFGRMTDREKIICLATRVMGWTFNRGIWMVLEDGELCLADYDDWNPLESIADAFEVQVAIPEPKRRIFGHALISVIEFSKDPKISPISATTWEIVNATARQRCDAIIEALGLEVK